MEIVFAVIGVLLVILGFIGCFLPVLPGPPLAYIALFLLQLGSEKPFGARFLLLTGALVVLVTVLDYLVPAWGAKKWGGSRFGVAGAFIGVIVGIFIFPPIGFLIFPLLGAVAGEMLSGADAQKAMKSAFGTMIGLFLGTVIKFSVTAFISFYFFTNL